MVDLYKQSGSLVKSAGSLAIAEACCCETCEQCLASIVAVSLGITGFSDCNFTCDNGFTCTPGFLHDTTGDIFASLLNDSWILPRTAESCDVTGSDLDGVIFELSGLSDLLITTTFYELNNGFCDPPVICVRDSLLSKIRLCLECQGDNMLAQAPHFITADGSDPADCCLGGEFNLVSLNSGSRDWTEFCAGSPIEFTSLASTYTLCTGTVNWSITPLFS